MIRKKIVQPTTAAPVSSYKHEGKRARKEHERAGRHVEARDLVAHVDQNSVRAARQHHRFHGGDQRRAGTEIGGEGDEGRPG